MRDTNIGAGDGFGLWEGEGRGDGFRGIRSRGGDRSLTAKVQNLMYIFPRHMQRMSQPIVGKFYAEHDAFPHADNSMRYVYTAIRLSCMKNTDRDKMPKLCSAIHRSAQLTSGDCSDLPHKYTHTIHRHKDATSAGKNFRALPIHW